MFEKATDDYALLAATPLDDDTADIANVHPSTRQSRLCVHLHPCRKIYNAATAFLSQNAGLLIISASQCCLAVVNVPVKMLHAFDPPVSTLQLVWVRMTITYLFALLYMLVARVPDPWIGPKGVQLLLVFRGLTGFVGLFCTYFSLQYLSLSDATALSFLAPLCTGFSGAYFLGERFTWKQACAGFVSLGGVVLIARPSAIFGHHTDDGVAPQQRVLAVCVSLVGVLGATGAFTSIRAIGRRAHPMHTLAAFALMCVLVSTAGMIATQTAVVIPPGTKGLTLLGLIGVFGFCAQLLLVLGLQRETASRGSMAMYTQILYAGIAERIFFTSDPSLLSVAGTVMIVASAIYVALNKPQEKKLLTEPEDETNKPLLEMQRIEEGGSHS